MPSIYSRPQFSLRTALVLVGVFAVLLGLAVGPVRALYVVARQAQDQVTTCNNLKQIMLALHNYADQNRYLPPPVTYTNSGEPATSWRFTLVPFYEQIGPEIFDDGRPNLHPYLRVDRDLAWNDRANLAAHGNLYYPMFQRVGVKQAVRGATNFIVVTGPETAFPVDRPISFSDITDDPAQTILVVEMTPSNIPWYEPRDLRFEEMSFRINDPDCTKPCIGNRELQGAFVGMADGSVRWLPETTPPETIKAMLTIAGGEQVEFAPH